jgi:hypothetical protein
MYGSVRNGMKMDMAATDMAGVIGTLHRIPATDGTRDIGIMTGIMVIIGFVAAGQEKDNIK